MKKGKTTPKEIRVFIIEDHHMLRGMLSKLIGRALGMMVCGQAASAEEALTQFAACRPDVLLTDLSLPGMGGLTLTRQLCKTHPKLLSLAISGQIESVYALRALDAGAKGYLMKDELIETANAIRQIYSGGTYLSEKVQAKLSKKGGSLGIHGV